MWSARRTASSVKLKRFEKVSVVGGRACGNCHVFSPGPGRIHGTDAGCIAAGRGCRSRATGPGRRRRYEPVRYDHRAGQPAPPAAHRDRLQCVGAHGRRHRSARCRLRRRRPRPGAGRHGEPERQLRRVCVRAHPWRVERANSRHDRRRRHQRSVVARRRLQLRDARRRQYRTHRGPQGPAVDALGRRRDRRGRQYRDPAAGTWLRRQPVRGKRVVRYLARRWDDRVRRRALRPPAGSRAARNRRDLEGRRRQRQ